MELLLDSLMDTLKMIPFLLVTFIAIEYFEHKFGKRFADRVKKSKKFGPILGALLGIIPQCGFSVIAAAFYTEGFVTLGTLIAVFVATSDEALPVLISTPSAAGTILPLILTKFFFAIFWGYIIDFVLRKKAIRKDTSQNHISDCENDKCINSHYDAADIVFHSIKRTVKIGIYIFIINFGIGAIVEYSGVATLASLMHKNSPIQIAIASIIGLIPNCAVSIGLVEVYINDAMGFAALIAGLSANAGLALLMLFKEMKNKKNFVLLVLTLAFLSFLTGIILYIFKI